MTRIREHPGGSMMGSTPGMMSNWPEMRRWMSANPEMWSWMQGHWSTMTWWMADHWSEMAWMTGHWAAP